MGVYTYSDEDNVLDCGHFAKKLVILLVGRGKTRGGDEVRC